MKRFFLFFISFFMTFSVALADIDLNILSFDQLASLRDQIMVEMMSRDDWQEVTVPAGTYQVGVHIPAGHWQITCAPQGYCHVTIGAKLEDNGKEIVYGSGGYYYISLVGVDSGLTERGSPSTVDLVLNDGMYIYIERSFVTFSPYAGIPDFGFIFK